MKVDEKFNKRAAKLVDVNAVMVRASPSSPEGVEMEFFEKHGDQRDLRVHLTPKEAIDLAMELLSKAHQKLGLNLPK